MRELPNNVELAVKAVIDGVGTGVLTYIGHDDQQRVPPAIIISADECNEHPIGSGNFFVRTTVSLRDSADTTSTELHKQRCGQVFGAIEVDDIATTLSGSADLYVFGVLNKEGSEEVNGREWVSTLRFDCYCCLSDLS